MTVRPLDSQRGLALITVLWVLTLLTVIAGSLTLTVRREINAVSNTVDLAEGRALADAGLRYALLQVHQPEKKQRWQPDGRWHQLQRGPVTQYLRVRPIGGRISLNEAPAELLNGLLAAVGVQDEARRRTIVANIGDWKDADEATRPGGSGERAASSNNSGPYNRPFRDVAELQQVPGITPDLYRRLAPNLTVIGDTAQVTAWAASRTVLLAMPGATPAMVDDYLARVQQAYANNTVMPVFPAGGQHLEQFGAKAYAIAAWARLPNGLWVGRAAEVARSEDTRTEPFVFLSLRELDTRSAPVDQVQNNG